MNKKITFVILFLLYFFNLQVKAETSLTNTSSYTSIEQKDCVTLDSDNMGSIQECESFEEITVKVIEGDIRQSIILTRNNREYDLAFWDTVGASFSSLGEKVEWRHEQAEPNNIKGIIFRFEASNDSEELARVSSYLVVSKITKKEICVVATILPQDNQNKVAREVLDLEKELPCLKKSDKVHK